MSRMRALAILLLPVWAAALPNYIYQEGVVTDGDGGPLEGEHRVDVRFYAGAGGGQAIYTERHDGVPFIEGYYAIAIGSVEALSAALFVRPAL